MKGSRRYLALISFVALVILYITWMKNSTLFRLATFHVSLGEECIACRKQESSRTSCADKESWPGCQRNEVDANGTNGSSDRRTGYHEQDEIFHEHPSVADKSIMIAISVRNRRGYVQFTSSVLRRYHGIHSQDIQLFLNTENKIKAGDLMKWYGVNLDSFPAIDGVTPNNELFLMLKHFLRSPFEYMLVISDDMIFSEEWRNFTLENLSKKSEVVLSIYHSSVMHSFTKDCENITGNLCVGVDIGTYGVVLTRSVALVIFDAMKSEKISGEMSWKIISDFTKIRLYYPPKSLSMMIGQTNLSVDNCGTNEVAYKFNRCEFPNWIKEGIEFYFDRCTSPHEEFFPDSSTKAIDLKGRFWTRPVVSYSLYGDDDAYIKTGLANALRVFSIYPGWKVWIYTDYSIPDDAMRKLCALDVRFVNTTGSPILSKMTWRFLVASAPVKMYAIRDADSYLLARGKAAVDEWIASGRKFHVMRGHPNHSKAPMSGGMWGGLHDAVPEMKDLLYSRNTTNKYGADMDFLRKVIWSKARTSVWAHDSHSIHKYGEDHPFPTKLENPRGFVGKVVIFRKKPRA